MAFNPTLFEDLSDKFPLVSVGTDYHHIFRMNLVAVICLMSIKLEQQFLDHLYLSHVAPGTAVSLMTGISNGADEDSTDTGKIKVVEVAAGCCKAVSGISHPFWCRIGFCGSQPIAVDDLIEEYPDGISSW